MTNTIFKGKTVEVLFLCDKNDSSCGIDNPFCGGDNCNHTTRLCHALNGHMYLGDPKKFLSYPNCVFYETDEKIIFMELPIKEYELEGGPDGKNSCSNTENPME